MTGPLLIPLPPLPSRAAPATMPPSHGPGVPMPAPALLLVAADALVARLRARVDAWAFDDMAQQRLVGLPGRLASRAAWSAGSGRTASRSARLPPSTNSRAQ